MKNKSLITTALSMAAIVGCMLFVAPVASADVDVGLAIGVPPPQPYYETAPAVHRGYIWVPGFWGWNGYGYVWHQGYWEPERRGYVYHPAYWDHDGDYWRFREERRDRREDYWEHHDRDHRYHEDHYDHGRG